MHLVLVERAVLERVRRVAGLLEVAVVERVAVDDQRPALRQVLDVRLQRGGVHRDEHVRLVARRDDVVVGEMHLEAGHAWERARGCADLGREVRQRREVVPEQRGLSRELRAGELHTVAGVAREADDDLGQLFDWLDHSTRPRQVYRKHPPTGSPIRGTVSSSSDAHPLVRTGRRPAHERRRHPDLPRPVRRDSRGDAGDPPRADAGLPLRLRADRRRRRRRAPGDARALRPRCRGDDRRRTARRPLDRGHVRDACRRGRRRRVRARRGRRDAARPEHDLRLLPRRAAHRALRRLRTDGAAAGAARRDRRDRRPVPPGRRRPDGRRRAGSCRRPRAAPAARRPVALRQRGRQLPRTTRAVPRAHSAHRESSGSRPARRRPRRCSASRARRRSRCSRYRWPSRH